MAGVIGLVGVLLLRSNMAHRRLWSWCGASIILAAVMFPTLYSKHSYYAAALSPAIAALLAGAFVAALQKRPRPYVAGVSLLFTVLTFGITAPQWTLAFWPADPDGEQTVAHQIAAATRPDELVLIAGRDWSPAVLFYADRRGIMLPAWAALPSDTSAYRVFDCYQANVAGKCTELSPSNRWNRAARLPGNDRE